MLKNYSKNLLYRQILLPLLLILRLLVFIYINQVSIYIYNFLYENEQKIIYLYFFCLKIYSFSLYLYLFCLFVIFYLISLFLFNFVMYIFIKKKIFFFNFGTIYHNQQQIKNQILQLQHYYKTLYKFLINLINLKKLNLKNFFVFFFLISEKNSK